jgi:hypothetical protein
MVLRAGVGEADVEQFAARLGYPRRAENEADEDNWVPRQIIWHAGSGAVVSYREDLLSELPYIVIMAQNHEELREFIELAEVVLNTWRLPWLLREVDTCEGSAADMSEAILRMGLGAPREFDNDFYSRVVRGLSNEHEEVVESALYATTYEPWQEYQEPVRRFLVGANGQCAEIARSIVEQFDAIEATSH